METTASQKGDVLIIEDSLATATLIQEFLKKLGYQNIRICDSGKSGIQTFLDLLKSEKVPIIFLDYNLPDMNASQVMENIFNVRPDTKIIIETAEEKSDDVIKDVLRHGAYDYLEKPIRFKNLQNTMNTLEEEEKTPEESLLPQNQIEFFLNASTRISLTRLSEYCKMDSSQVLDYLSKLESEGKAAQVGKIKEISCYRCGSVKVGQTFHCPSCDSVNFKRSKLIEHYKCGNFSPEDSYQNNICPKCRKEIKILGVDYRVMENYYICEDCGNKFSEFPNEYLCLHCNNKFKLEQAKWISSEGFRAVNL